MGARTSAGEAWQQRLRASGYRLTSQRRQLLEALGSLGHATPEELHSAVGDAANLSTVYRTLELLEGLGLVRHTHLSHSSPSYSVIGPAEHVHVVCRDCEAVQEVDARLLDGLVADIDRALGFGVDVGHLSLFGTCVTCRQG